MPAGTSFLQSLLGRKPPIDSTKRQPTLRSAARAPEIIQIRLNRAQLVLSTGAGTSVRANETADVENTSGGAIVTERPNAGQHPVCMVEVPAASTVEAQIELGGLTVHNFQGNLRARLASGSAKVEQCEGRLRIVAVVGSVSIEHVRGAVDVLGTNGAIKGHSIDGDLQVVSNGGSIEFERIDGSITARSTSGNISTKDTRGPLRLTSRTGSVRVSIAAGPLKVRTQSGDVMLETSIVDHTTVETFKGNLDVRLGSATDARLDATTRQGVIRSQAIPSGPGSSRRVLRSTFGAGRARLQVATGLGLIEIAGPPLSERPPR